MIALPELHSKDRCLFYYNTEKKVDLLIIIPQGVKEWNLSEKRAKLCCSFFIYECEQCFYLFLLWSHIGATMEKFLFLSNFWAIFNIRPSPPRSIQKYLKRKTLSKICGKFKERESIYARVRKKMGCIGFVVEFFGEFFWKPLHFRFKRAPLAYI